MSILKNTTEGISYPLLPYQQVLLTRLQAGGVAAGKMSIMSSGRQIGKSYINALYNRVNPCNEISLPMRKATEAKYKFSRANWYVAEYNWVDYTEAIAWCTQQFGPHPNQPDAWSRWEHKWGLIKFRDEKDCMLFLLRWT